MKHDVGANPAGAFQFDDSIARFPVDSETEVEDIEPRDGLDVAHVEQYSAKDGRRNFRKVLLGHAIVSRRRNRSIAEDQREQHGDGDDRKARALEDTGPFR